MADVSDIQLLDHELADDELAWVQSVYRDFSTARAAFSGREKEFRPKEALREVLNRKEHQMPDPMELTGDGPWRLGKNRHGRGVAAVFLKKVELHRHPKSRTDQFIMYIVGEADAYSEGENGQPILTPVTGGDHCHNAPNAPHAFVPKVGKPVGNDWEIAFIAITPRNLREDTHKVSDATKSSYRQVVGQEAPAGV